MSSGAERLTCKGGNTKQANAQRLNSTTSTSQKLLFSTEGCVTMMEAQHEYRYEVKQIHSILSGKVSVEQASIINVPLHRPFLPLESRWPAQITRTREQSATQTGALCAVTHQVSLSSQVQLGPPDWPVQTNTAGV